ncbi:MAG: M12 family metallopeptidase [Acidobacteriota bacterium]|nr:M12 family metallopeptidase [Acidobacteriota bacterium]
MRKIKGLAGWQIVLVCLMALLGAMTLRQASAQTGQQIEERIPGIPPGYTIIEGDIQMPISVVTAMRRRAEQSSAAPETTFQTNLWPNGIIPFEFETNCEPTSTCNNAPNSGCVGIARIAAMLEAMKVLEDAANVDFRNCPNNECGGNHIRIRDTTNDTTVGAGNACSANTFNNSGVGVQGGQQIINIASWTGASSKFIIVHELLHAVGILHEQSRRDRGLYVAINCGNIQGDSGDCKSQLAKDNFQLEDGSQNYGPYDFDSVMHYKQCAFSAGCGLDANGVPIQSCDDCKNRPTITVNAPNEAQQTAIGQRTHLSDLDRLTLSFLYARPDWRFVDPTYTGGNGAANGTFLRPYPSLATGINATPVRGTLWLQPGTYGASGLSKQITIRAPFGGVTIVRRTGVAEETLASISAASYNGELAAESIVAAFGLNLAPSTAIAMTLPLPTQLAGVTVKVKDAEGVERDAPLFFVSPNQINYQIPAGTSIGIATIAVHNGGGNIVPSGTVPITAAAPALFSANASGQGVPAASLLRVRGDGQFYEPVARYDAQLQQFVPAPIDLGPEGDQVFLILFGTGFRAAGTAGVRVMIGDEEAEVLYAGPAPGFAGLDQANVRVPRSLVGKGEVTIQLTADNRSANAVTVNVR